MVKEEAKVSKRGKSIRGTKIQRAVLKAVSVAGFLTVAVVAPNALQMFAGPLGFGRKKKTHTRIFTRAARRLVEKGFLVERRGNIRITSMGERVLAKMERKDFKLPCPKRWDKRWRILIFDIAEYRKTTRDKLRTTLNSVGFVRLQDSVWVYPFDCEDFITLLKTDFEIGEDLLYIIADTIENDRWLRENFGLA